MLKYSLGLDISSQKFDACLSSIDASQHVIIKAKRQFSNNEIGFKLLVTWLKTHCKNKEIPLVICMEATGIYYENCAFFLFNAGFKVSIILPNKAKKYFASIGIKSKNDSIDANGLSRMGAEQNLTLWQPLGNFFYLLRSLTRQLQSIQELKTSVSNQLHASEKAMYELKFVVKQQKKLLSEYNKIIEKLENEIEKHLKSNEEVFVKIKNILAIKGVGLLTIAVLLGETNGFELFNSASQLVCYSGYDVVENQSGKHHGRTKMSKKGNSRIRRSLFMPAFCAVKDKESVFFNLYERVYSKSNIKMKAYAAVQKKLLVIIYSIWKKNEMYSRSVINSGDVEKDILSPLLFTINKIVPANVALHKVIYSIEASKSDSSPLVQNY
jgi:transposase